MKIFSFLTIIFFGVVFLHTTTEVNGQDNMICVECQQYFEEKCTVQYKRVVPGEGMDLFLISHRLPLEEDKNPNLAKCLPDTYKLEGQLKQPACGLSPEHGCTMMTVPKDEKHNEEFCVKCGKSCGCKNWDKKDVKSKSSASRLMMNGCMLAACLTLVVNAFLN